MKNHLIIISGIVFSTTLGVNAQKQVVNEEINITKERQIELNKANRIFDKIPPAPVDKSEKKMTYSFYDRKPTAVEVTNFQPNVVNPISNQSKKEEISGFNNYFKVGIGNFGRIYAETFINSNQDNKFSYGFSGLHNSTKRGPVAAENSATSINKFGADGKYNADGYELKLDVNYERRNYYFYGYDTEINSDYLKEDLRQKVNYYSAGITFENTKPDPKVDFSLKTGVKSLNDNFNASELDWGTTFNSYFPIIKDKVTAQLAAEAFLTQRADIYSEENLTLKRNLYRVEPSFRFDINRFTAKVGFKAVNEFDQIEKINTTKGFPTASLSYKLPSLIYFFVGFDGDIIRNTLHSFLNENPFVVETVNLLNTYKNQDWYIGSRGDLFSGLNYNAKVSYGKYQNLYYFNKYEGTPLSSSGIPISTTKFQAEYEDEQTDFVNVSGEFGYNSFESWKPSLKLDYYYYETKKFAKPFHRPSFVGRVGNTFSVTDKLISSVDFYYMGGLWAKDPELIDPVKLKNIADLNTEFTYLFSKQFSVFVKLNNILGKNYERYYNYPQLGLNFVAGINVAL